MKHGKQPNSPPPREIELVDFSEPEVVEVQISKDGKSLWINVNGVCAWRATRIKSLQLVDDRKPAASKLVTSA